MADASLFTDCKTSKTYPVAMEKDNISLERAYGEVVEISGENILVTLTGHFEKRKHFDSDTEKEFLIVDKFDKIWPDIGCIDNLGIANLKNTFWSLRELNGIYRTEFESKKDIHFVIDLENNLKGFSGCNNYFGSTTIKNDSIKFVQITSTLISCKNYGLETDFLKMMKKVNYFKIYGEFLYFYENDNLISKFESVYF
jgi:heat shock protein HslJ